jgi:hypothetical protein
MESIKFVLTSEECISTNPAIVELSILMDIACVFCVMV